MHLIHIFPTIKKIIYVLLSLVCGYLSVVAQSYPIALEKEYDRVGFFKEGFAPVELKDKAGFIDKMGREKIPCIYQSTYFFENGLARVKIGDKFGYIDTTGKEVVDLIYDEGINFSENLSFVKKDKKWYIIKNPLVK